MATVTTYRLVTGSDAGAGPPDLDAEQQAVVDHPGGPLLVLAGPGTGKTTTLVEAVVARLRRGTPASRMLVLTFGRRAAGSLRDRIAARLGGRGAVPVAVTFHSYCYSLLARAQPAEAFPGPLRVLTAPQQDARLRDLLAGGRESGRAGWPGGLAAAVGTHGFAEQLRAVLARASELGLGPADLVRSGELAARPEWVAAGTFFGEYLDVLGAEGVVDYAELIAQAVRYATDPAFRRRLRAGLDAVFVDEYQDTDPAQVRLLAALAGDGRDLVAVGDPDQSIYGFRGADVHAILRFPEEFRRSDGAPAPVVALRRTRRFGPVLLAATRSVAQRMGTAGALPRAAVEAFRGLQASADGPGGAGRVEVLTFPSEGAELDHVAELLRRAHLDAGVPWSELAVLVRSAVASVPPLQRALAAAGVPVEVAGDELPLSRQPAARALLRALAVAADPAELTVRTAEELLCGPLGGIDGVGLRRLGAALRTVDAAAGSTRPAAESVVAGGRQPPATATASGVFRPAAPVAPLDGELRVPGSSLAGEPVVAAPAPPAGELVREVVDAPELLGARFPAAAGLPAGRAARSLGALVREARAILDAGGTPAEGLWALWSGTSWPRRLQAAATAGGSAGRAADRDLDAVCGLFDAAGRTAGHTGRAGARTFLADLSAQQIPADARLESATRGDAVRVLTAHRAKGLQWRQVVVCGVQEGSWPDLRRRGSLLDADRLGVDGLLPGRGAGALLAEERRLFYVACTRARERLVVTAVAAPEADGIQPSRFVAELGVPPAVAAGRPTRPLSLAGVVGTLRALVSDPDRPEPLRRAAADRLARLAVLRDPAGAAVAPAAHPDGWWGRREPTRTAAAVRPAEAPVRVSGSWIDDLLECPLRWFLAREGAGRPVPSAALATGRVVHALAAGVARRELPADPAAVAERLAASWPQVRFAARWLATRELAETEQMLGRFLGYHAASTRRLAAVEHRFDVGIPVPGGDTARLIGSMDRVEVDADSGVHVVDLKTTRTPPTGPKVAADGQLGCYQEAIRAGAVADLLGPGRQPAGAELVQLRAPGAGGAARCQPQQPPELDSEGRDWVLDRLAAAVDILRTERFAARTGEWCRRCPFRTICPAWPEGQGVVP